MGLLFLEFLRFNYFFDGTFGTYKLLYFVTLHSGSVTLEILRLVATINYLSRNN